jgi:hypothetical protein
MFIHRLLACAAAVAATAVLPADLMIPMGTTTNIGAMTQTYDNVSCAGTMEMTYPAMVDARASVMLSDCMLVLDVPMGTALPPMITVIDNMSAMPTSGMFMGLPEGAVVMLGGMTYYIDYMGGDGNDVVLSTMMPGSMMPPLMPMPMPMPKPGTNVEDMWWSPYQNGWGMSLVAHGEAVFAALYVYDDAGNPRWYVMPNSSWDSTHTVLTGALFAPTGSPFFAYDASRLKAGSSVGTLTITFQDYSDALIDYTIGGASGRKYVMREGFGSGAQLLHDPSDLWWGGSSQNGWGMTVRQQESSIFTVWFTYDANGNATWYAMPGGSWTASDTYEGRAYRTIGTPWIGNGYDQAKLQVMDAGSYRLKFGGDGATFTYSIDGHDGTLALSRQPF